MKNSLAAAAILAMGATAAQAADLPYRKAPPVAVAPAYDWTGFYVGANAGWVGSVNNDVGLTGTDTGGGGFGSELADGSTPRTFNTRYSGFIGGGQVGYNKQFGTWLLGVEADIMGSNASASATHINLPQPPFPARSAITTVVSNKLNYLGTVRGRLGVVVNNPLLLYVTGGLAYGQTELGVSSVCPTCGPARNLATTSGPTNFGWTVGAGAEWMFAANWTAKVEYLYYDLGTNTTAPLVYNYGASTSTLTASIRETGQLARVGINYKWGGPLVAKY
ncbi:outer membrane beta-barrel protein [Bradyrhizobium sediminis]|uniref:Outer membrane beta-barrel protein n=1 Tax=Bradyrhizobium sediminis TaxID=2840469 RepID=A0A975RQ64_9BRAD|nr:outer membrane beta-barrel protein [Bradyrhizobium sediminis]QWG15331.1 outer membrane beta-barrel protein [Bradyrhizobium sediminis]